MTAPLKTVEASNIAVLMHETAARAKSAARVLALAPTAQKDSALATMAAAIRARQAQVLAANAEDMAEAKAAGATAAFLDRLALDECDDDLAFARIGRRAPSPVRRWPR